MSFSFAMFPFKKKPTESRPRKEAWERPFIKPWVTDARDFSETGPKMRDVYRYINQPPISCEKMESIGIVEAGPKLYKLMQQVGNNAIRGIYSIPACRKYYGDDFIHGVIFEYLRTPEDRLVFQNTDDKIECLYFTKEVIKIIGLTLKEWFEKYDYWIMWKHSDIVVVKGPPDYRAYIDSSCRVTWFN